MSDPKPPVDIDVEIDFLDLSKEPAPEKPTLDDLQDLAPPSASKPQVDQFLRRSAEDEEKLKEERKKRADAADKTDAVIVPKSAMKVGANEDVSLDIYKRGPKVDAKPVGQDDTDHTIIFLGFGVMAVVGLMIFVLTKAM